MHGGGSFFSMLEGVCAKCELTVARICVEEHDAWSLYPLGDAQEFILSCTVHREATKSGEICVS
jgi:hypothetical protein